MEIWVGLFALLGAVSVLLWWVRRRDNPDHMYSGKAWRKPQGEYRGPPPGGVVPPGGG
jgi:hypothetical protein